MNRVIVPPRILLHGDREKAAAYIGAARLELVKLERDMAFSGVEQGERGPIMVSPDGVTVICTVSFDQRNVIIKSPSGGGGGENVETKCLCNCNFSLGWVVEKQLETIDSASLYTVMACNFKKRFTRYENVLASDWTEYIPGQKVLLVPYYQMAWLCCQDPTMDYGGTGGYGCRAELSVVDIDNDAWRTAYRIVPYNARMIPKTIEVRR